MSSHIEESAAVTEGMLDRSPVCECEFVTYKGTLGCNNNATWWGVNLCCGERGLYCDSCKYRADGNGDPRYRLDVCGNCHGRGIRWTKL